MKTTITTLLTAICISGLLLSAAAQPAGPPDNSNTAATPDQSTQANTGTDANATATPDTAQGQPAQDQGAMGVQDATQADQTQAAPAQDQPITSTAIAPRGNAPQTVPSVFAPPAQTMGTNQNDLNMNFVNAPLDEVLTYLSDAAGFIVVQQTRVNGYVTIKGTHMTRDDAVNLLNSELNRNNYAAFLDGRTLTIVDRNDAKTSRIPVMIGNDPNAISNNDQIATWIIPIRFVEARQLVSDLSLFVSPQATIVANEAGNSIVITDTQANIRHLAQIIQAVDNSAESETEIQVFKLRYASPIDVANELGSIFPSSGGSSGSQAPIQFGRGGGRGGGFGGGRFGGRGGGNPFAALFSGGGNADPTQQRIQKATQVTAVADARTQAVIVTAPKDLMSQIADMMTELDVPSERDQNVAVIQLNNSDPNQVAQVLQSMFGGNNNARGGTSSSQNSALQTRTINGVTTMGQTTTTSGIGGAGAAGGGGGR